MFCQNANCGTEVASSYKICPKCGGRSFGPQRGVMQPEPSVQRTVSNKIAVGHLSNGSGGNVNNPFQRNLIMIGMGFLVFLLLAAFGYKYVRDVEIERQNREVAVAREIEFKRIAEEEARQRQAEIEREHRKQVAQRLAEAAKDAIINKVYQGGQNKGVSVQEWSYDSVEDRYLLKVSLSWDGVVMASNHYAADGTVSVKGSGAGTTWNPTWVNDQLREYQGWRNLAVGTVVIGVIATGSSSDSSQ